MLIFAVEKGLQLRNRLTAKLTTRVKVRFICSSHRLPHLKPYSNILYKASCRKRHWKCSNKDRIQCSPLLRHRLNFLDCPAAWNGLHPLHSTSHYSECSFNTQRAGPVTCASRDSTLECGSLRVDHCQPCASDDSGYCGDAGSTKPHRQWWWINALPSTTSLRCGQVQPPIVQVECSSSHQHYYSPITWTLLLKNSDKTASVSIYLKKKKCLLARFAQFIISINGCSQNANPMQ